MEAIAVNPVAGYTRPMSQPPPDMKVRLSSTLRQQVEEAAKRNNRTLNGEIVARLEKSFAEEQGEHRTRFAWAKNAARSAADQRFAELEARVAALEKKAD
ncbi:MULTISPECIES: Arc family DNA-binding protein [unclassified Aurantimonas]|uniref:Arc family DNA-binding protein n=1 Tax=unclassified Aurantimonas TaxID=2638230 RepID=UPI002E173DFA|nr:MULTISPECIES: Arc family DNA-binding protein [unclassified Aurantimonas]MEC5291300.1 Arc family DNA-binding protein [Aurantimonas sp. C2-3-R2]MEC5412329.1 Arc family DNA-binding protein [Aurantimonas sp. C2-4-R8]